jgi:6-phosphofructokinase 2
MTHVLTITLNPALDVATSIARVEVDRKLRCHAPRIDPGGGGVNVSRAMAKMGARSRAFLAHGGVIGEALLGRLDAEGIETVRFAIPGETRLSFAVREEDSGHQYRFVLPGPDWTPAVFDDCRDALQDPVAQSECVAISGSFPPGLGPEAVRETVALAAGRGAHVLVDTSGAALDRLLEAEVADRVVLVTNKDEAERLAGGALGVEAAASFAGRLRERSGAACLILTLGAAGAVAATPAGRFHVSPPDAPIVSKVGAGDSFAAGFIVGLGRTGDIHEGLRRAMAAATSAITTPATELCTREGVEKYLPEIELKEL